MPDISKEYIKGMIGEGATIVEVGCYDGKDSAELAEVCKTEVHCFECDDRAIALFKAREDKRLFLYPYAVTSHHGKCLFFPSKSDKREKQSSGSIRVDKKHKKIFPDVKFAKQGVPVPCTTLDHWYFHVLQGHYKKDIIDFLWVDVNGGEGNFLLGASLALSKTRYLYIEFCEVELYEKALNRKRMIKTLPGFECIGEYNFEGNFGNLLFKNKNEELFK